MARRYVFADEAGNFDFSSKQGASKYFILTTITMVDCSVGDALLALRRQLVWEGPDGMELQEEFHATTDRQAIRDRVYAVIASHDFRVDALVVEKRKAQPKFHVDRDYFYKTVWYYHLKYLARRLAGPEDELLVVGATLETRKRHAIFHAAIADVVR
jgi:hypothetical protein